MYSNILLTVDFDRTLTAPDSSIPQRNIEAIAYFMAHGGSFTINTGRSIPMCQKSILGKVPTNAPLLLYNGSAAYDQNARQLSLCRIIDLPIGETVRQVQAQFPDLTVEIQGRDAHYILSENPGWEAYSDNGGCAWSYCPPEEIPGPFLKFSLYGEFREHTVASMYQATEAELARFDQVMAYLKETYGDVAEVFRPCARIIDIHAKGTSKLRAARDLQKALGKEILVCVGDAENDLSMLEGADFAFCPADGVVADRFPNVCECAKGAIADVIYEKIPEILKINLDKQGNSC